MSKHKPSRVKPSPASRPQPKRAPGLMIKPATPEGLPLAHVTSLLGAMKDGAEYASIVEVLPDKEINLVEEVKRSLADIAAIRGRPCVMYVGNVANGTPDAAVMSRDEGGSAAG